MPPGMAAGNAASETLSPTVALRSTQYFAAKLDEARRIVNGSTRGDEGKNVEQAIRATESGEQLKRFIGK